MKPFELVVVVGVRLVDRRQVIGVHDEKAAPQGVGGVPVFHPGQSHEQPPAVLARVSDDVTAFFAAVTKFFGAQRITRSEPGGGVVGADFHHHLAADAVRFDDAPDCQLQGSSISSARYRSVSTTSTRIPRPPIPATSVRNAVAVRPPRPITLPRSSGWTCTSTVRPRRLVTRSTRTSSGLSTIPRTRCSTASTTTVLIAPVSFPRTAGPARSARAARRPRPVLRPPRPRSPSRQRLRERPQRPRGRPQRWPQARPPWRLSWPGPSSSVSRPRWSARHPPRPARR